MEEIYIQDKTFDRTNLAEAPLIKGEYENCIFDHCDFSNNNLSGFRFIECEFTGCNLSLTAINMTTLTKIKFKDCKMLGLRFDSCYKLAISFTCDHCRLDHASFYKTSIQETVFKNSQLKQTDFAECNLTNAIFQHCDLAGAIFDHSILEKTDFRTAYNYSINPATNRIKKAKFSTSGIAGLLDQYDIVIEDI